MRSLPDELLIGPYRLDCRKRWLTLPSGSRPNQHQDLSNAPFSLLEELVRASPACVHAESQLVSELRKLFRALDINGGPDPIQTVREGKGQYRIFEVWEPVLAGTSYGDRLLRAFSLQLLRESEPTPNLPWRPELEPASIVFASERAVLGPDGNRRLLMTQETKKDDETQTDDELTGDGVALHRIAVQLTRLGAQTSAVPSRDCKEAFGKGQPTVLIGGPYSNEYLSKLEEAELSGIKEPFGARFDLTAPLSRRQLHVTLHDGSPTPPFGEIDIVRKGEKPPKFEYAVLRRWLSVHNTDTLLIAGLTAQGTSAAAKFFCDKEGMQQVFDRLHERGVEDKAWEWTQWDALLKIELTDGRALPNSEIEVVAAAPR